jgi:amino acid transporter
LESFKRAPGTTGGLHVAADDSNPNAKQGKDDNPMLQQKMKSRHLQMIAVSIATESHNKQADCEKR